MLAQVGEHPAFGVWQTRGVWDNGVVSVVAGLDEAMPIEMRKSWLRRRVEGALVQGLTRAYETVKVDPGKFLLQLRAAYSLPIMSFDGVYSIDLNQLDDVAESIVRSGVKMAAAEGAGLGLGGIITIVPDLGILSAITMRTIQKLSLLYGFEFNTEEEMADLWIAAASAAGVDISRELLEKEVINRFVPRVIQRIAAQASVRSGRKVGWAPDSVSQFTHWFSS